MKSFFSFIKNISKTNKLFILLVVSFILLVINVNFPFFSKIKNGPKNLSENVLQQSEVLGDFISTPELYISNNQDSSTVGGVMSFSSMQEPSLSINSYKVNGIANFSLYEANKDLLLNYLVHDSENNQINNSIDRNSLSFVSSFEYQINEDKTTIPLPLQKNSGIWFLEMKIGNISKNIFIVRSKNAVLAKEGNNEIILWAQSFETKRSLPEAAVSIFNLNNSINQITSVNTDSEGVAKVGLNPDFDIAFIEKDGDIVLLPLNLKNINYSYDYNRLQLKQRESEFFIFTDRPVYRPGDSLFFKVIMRDDDDANYTIPQGTAVVKVISGDNEIFSKNFQISSEGTVSGEVKIPDDAKTGSYYVNVDLDPQSDNYTTEGDAYFSVEYFRKPEYSIDLETDKDEYITGEKVKATVSGNYFFGQPISKQKVKYKVYTSNFFEYDIFSEASYKLNHSYRYGYWYGKEIQSGEVTFNEKGEITFDLDTKLTDDIKQTQVFSVEMEFADGTSNPAFARKNILVYRGDFSIYEEAYKYSTKINESVDMPIVLSPNKEGADVSNIEISVIPKLTKWVRIGNAKETTKEEKNFSKIKSRTDNKGKTNISFVPDEGGSYTFIVSASDEKGNAIEKDFNLWVTSNDFYYSEYNISSITIKPDKETYKPGEKAILTITTNSENQDVFIGLERDRLYRYIVLSLKGKTGLVEVPIVENDIPNIFADVSTFLVDSLSNNTTNILVSTGSKKLNIEILPDKEEYSPSEMIKVKVKTTNEDNKPISAELALWAVDKAIFELANNLGDIFSTFWYERYHSTITTHSLEGIDANPSEGGGGCFAEGTKILMQGSKYKNIEDVRVGDKILTRNSSIDENLVKAKVTGVHKTTVDGYLIINESIKITPEHILWVNGGWKEAGEIVVGDILINKDGEEIKVVSIFWQLGKYEVYNLEIKSKNTFFADNIWVHNQKGDARQIFKDTAYWNPSLKTDSEGKAEIMFKLPDNLTTWVLSSVGSTQDTKVGQSTKDITVTKDIVIRPILPNILRVGDNVILSSLVHNFTDQKEILNAELNFNSGDIKTPKIAGIDLDSKSFELINWEVDSLKENEEAELKYSLVSKENEDKSDIVIQKIPVRPYGFTDQVTNSFIGPFEANIKLEEISDKAKTSIKLYLSHTITGNLKSAISYLVNYPWGCTEQISSFLSSAIVAKENSQIYSEVLKGKNVDELITIGIKKIVDKQKWDGGWTWWYVGNSDPFVTSYVLEKLLLAKELGYKINSSVFDDAENYLLGLVDSKEKTKEEEIIIHYGLSLLENEKAKNIVTDFESLSPDIVALAILANINNGYGDNNNNGVNYLLSMAKEEGDSIFWEAGKKEYFGSVDASTALALKTLIVSGQSGETVSKAARFLAKNRHFIYWSNTFATSQVVSALTDYSRKVSEFEPNFTYKVYLDGQIIKNELINRQSDIQTISIDSEMIKEEGSTLKIEKDGEGQLYSTVQIDEFITDKYSESIENGLSILRSYINDRGYNYNLGVGDIVTVKLAVKGSETEEKFALIEDELPAGMIPVNPNLMNEQFNQPSNVQNNEFVEMNATENGMILSIYSLKPGWNTYEYKARVVSQGSFITPPAKVHLMYAPEINARTFPETVSINKTSKKDLFKTLLDYIYYLYIVAFISLLIWLGFFIKKVIKNRKKRQQNDIQNNDQKIDEVSNLQEHPDNKSSNGQ